MSRGNRDDALAALNAEVRGLQADQEIFDATVAEFAGLNRTDWRCLDILGSRGPLTAGELADAARLSTGALTVVLDHLEAAGLVRRIRDTVDRRRVIIETTPELERRVGLVYGPLMIDTAAALKAFDMSQLAIITDFVRRERGLLAKHAERVRRLPQATGADPN